MECKKTEELTHHGIPGMKWGIRRYQHKDGSLTPAGRKRVDKLQTEYKSLTGKRLGKKPISKSVEKTNKPKRIKDMSDEELRTKINRMENEKRYATLQVETGSRGKRFVSTVNKQVITPAAIESGKRLLTDLFVKVGKNKLRLNEQELDAFGELQKEAKTSRLKRQIEEDKDWFARRENKKN